SLIGFSIFKFVLPKIEKKGKVELIYWGLWESEGVMNQIIADFNREYPEVKVKYTMQSKQEYRERLQSSLARDEGPDIFRFHIAWTPMLKNQLDKVPEDVFSASQYQSTFYPVAASQLMSGSGYLGIPLEVDTLALFYNKEIFQMAGKTPPKTWEELRSAAIDLTVRDASGRIQTAGVALGNTTNIEHWSDILGLMMVQNGVDLNMVSKCSTFESEEVCLGVDALRFYTLFNKVDQVWNSSMPNSTESFASGKLAMYFGYSWDVFEIQARNKNLNFGVVEAPQLSGEKISWASFWVEGVNNKSGFKEEAWQFMKFLSKKETLEKLYSLSSNTRAFGEPYPRVDMKAMLSSNPLVFPFVNQASYAQTWYLCSRTYDNGINDKMIDYFKDAVNAVNSNKDPKQALETASMGVSQLLSQYGLGSYTVR
ncbi:MAG: extracellular solute-binding protein, partial [Patescibacteria group bacterium]